MTAIPQSSPEDRYVIALAYQTLGQVLNSIAGNGNYRAVAVAPEEGVRVTILIEQYDGPNVGRWEPTPTADPPISKTREIDLNILEACDVIPQSIKRIAERAGYGNNPFFREAIYRLLESGVIIRVRGGIRLAP